MTRRHGFRREITLIAPKEETTKSVRLQKRRFHGVRAQLIDENQARVGIGSSCLHRQVSSLTIVYQGYASGATREEIETLWNVGINLTQNVLPT